MPLPAYLQTECSDNNSIKISYREHALACLPANRVFRQQLNQNILQGACPYLPTWKQSVQTTTQSKYLTGSMPLPAYLETECSDNKSIKISYREHALACLPANRVFRQQINQNILHVACPCLPTCKQSVQTTNQSKYLTGSMPYLPTCKQSVQTTTQSKYHSEPRFNQ